MKKQLTKSTKLRIVESPGLASPCHGHEVARSESRFWKELGSKTGADFIVSGIVDFDISDKSGYRTEEYVNPSDGRTFYRQVLVESTGFVFDIDIAVFNGDTGEKVVEENFRDFKEFDSVTTTKSSDCSRTCARSRASSWASSCHRRHRPRGTCSLTRLSTTPHGGFVKRLFALLIVALAALPAYPFGPEQDRLRQVQLEHLPLDALRHLFL